MRRSICYCEPSAALANEVNTWKFIYTTATTLPKKTRLVFDLDTDGRDIDWEIPSTNLKKSGNIIFAKANNGKILQAKELEHPERFAPLFEFTLPAELKAGGQFTITIGSPKPLKSSLVKNGNRTQSASQRRRSFFLYIDPTGKGEYDEPEVFSMDIRGNKLHNIRVLAPSYVTKNKRFDIVVRFEDEFDNLTSHAPEDTLVQLSYNQLRENLNWKLFVPETGFITLPNLYFNETGIYIIELLNANTNEVFYSAPIKCFADSAKSLHWGLLHGESERVDSTHNIESCLRHFRDDRALSFYCSSPFESQEETPTDLWRFITQNVLEFDEDDRFSTLIGFQWQGEDKREGLRHIIYNKDQKQLLRQKEAKSSSLSKIYKSVSPKEIISVPCFTMGKGTTFNFNKFDPEFERVVEIYNAWGSSECTKKEGNTRPIHAPGRKGAKETEEGSIEKALQNNCRFGFVAGGLDDRGAYAEFYDQDQEQYSPGLTAIISSDQSRSSLFEALYQRSCYATTGERILLGFELAGQPMGSELNTGQKRGLTINRHISGSVAGTDDLKTIEIIRNGKAIKTFKPDGFSLDFTYDDMEPIEKVVIDAKDQKPPFVYYYIRVTQKDGHLAWSSPIWIDYIKTPATKSKG